MFFSLFRPFQVCYRKILEFFSKKFVAFFFVLFALNMIRLLKNYRQVFIQPLIYECRFTGNSYFNCPGVTQKNEICLKGVFTKLLLFKLTVNVVGVIKKVLVGSNNPNWTIFWDGLIFNCPGC